MKNIENYIVKHHYELGIIILSVWIVSGILILI
jgi:hypothetical protein